MNVQPGISRIDRRKNVRVRLDLITLGNRREVWKSLRDLLVAKGNAILVGLGSDSGGAVSRLRHLVR